jgi:hypothetical protein
VEVKQQFQAKISNRFAALENLNDDDNDDNVEKITENIQASAKESLSFYELKNVICEN